MFTPEYYLARAADMADAAGRASDENLRAGYLELSRGFLDMANLARVLTLPGHGQIQQVIDRLAPKGRP